MHFEGLEGGFLIVFFVFSVVFLKKVGWSRISRCRFGGRKRVSGRKICETCRNLDFFEVFFGGLAKVLSGLK